MNVDDASKECIGDSPGLDSAGLHRCLQKLYRELLVNPAISGLTLGVHWDEISFSKLVKPPFLPERYVSDGYDWSFVDDAFDVTGMNQTVQLIITPGFDTPLWVLAELPTCDTLFTSQPTAVVDCGQLTFSKFRQHRRADGSSLPLPWESFYQYEWMNFLQLVAGRYGSNTAFVAIAVAGPTGASTEMIYPTTLNDPHTQPSGKDVDDTWAAVIKYDFPHRTDYQGTDQVFIDAWKAVIAGYESTFSGVTLIVSPDAGRDLPEFNFDPATGPPPHSNIPLNQVDCSKNQTPLSCAAKTAILTQFGLAQGLNGKATQLGGLTASSDMNRGDLGIAGVKYLALNPSTGFSPIIGGAEFDHPVSGGSLQKEGCPTSACNGLTPELGAYNVLAVFFDQTQQFDYYNKVRSESGRKYKSGPYVIQYLDVPYPDVIHANRHPCPSSLTTILGSTSLQDLLNHARYDLLVMAKQQPVLPPATCPAPGL